MWRPPICRTELLKRLGLTDKIPAEFKKTFYSVDCPNRLGETVATLDVMVKASEKKRHRIKVRCPKCDKWVGFGRWRQHEPVHES